MRFLLLITLFLTTFNIFAWDAMGHRIIAAIAYSHLDPQAKQRSNELIDYLADAYPYSSSFQTASAWADYIKQDDIHAYDNWHFDDIPFSTDGTPTQPANTANILWALTQCMAILKDPKSNQFEKAFFLRFLLHFVGDAHQPLHCANRFSANFPNGDEGGNLFPIQENNYTNLHAYWDDGLGFFDEHCSYTLSKFQQANCLANKIQQDYPENYFGPKAQDIHPQDWVNESYLLAKNFAYQTPENQPLSNAYVQQGQKIVEQQLALAGYRLAAVLNNLFG